MEEETTSRLEKTLRELSNEDEATVFIDEHKGKGWNTFSDYFLDYMGINDLLEASIVRDAGFGEYAYHIIDGSKSPANRDRVISLCIAAGMNVKETDRALRIAGHNPLSPKNARDVRIVVCINQGITKVIDVNLELDKFNLEPLK